MAHYWIDVVDTYRVAAYPNNPTGEPAGVIWGLRDDMVAFYQVYQIVGPDAPYSKINAEINFFPGDIFLTDPTTVAEMGFSHQLWLLYIKLAVALEDRATLTHRRDLVEASMTKEPKKC